MANNRIARATAKLGFGTYYGQNIVHRDLQSLKNCRIYLKPSVKSFKMNVLMYDVENEGGRRFLWEHVPGLRYRNPSVQFSFSGTNQLPAAVTIGFDDGQEVIVDTLNKSLQDVCSEVFSKTVEDYSPVESSAEVDRPDESQQQTG